MISVVDESQEKTSFFLHRAPKSSSGGMEALNWLKGLKFMLYFLKKHQNYAIYQSQKAVKTEKMLDFSSIKSCLMYNSIKNQRNLTLKL